MSKHKRKLAKAKPISANPLFPAVVALWFGALFGLGSLAVRPSLLEDLVLRSHLDLVVPAAAPPLGITARILLALVLAALGAVLGIMLARRLTRPKVEERERKRSAKDLADTPPRVRHRDAHPDAPSRRPISALEEFGDQEALGSGRPAAGVLASRRRALAIDNEPPAFVPHEPAPLPGLAPVQPLDLASLALPSEASVAAGAEIAPQPASAVPPLDWTRTVQPAAPAAPDPVSPEAGHDPGRQVFGTISPPVPDTAPRQIFGIEVRDDHVPQDFVRAAGFQTSVFDTPEPSPLFDRPVESAPAAPVAETPAPAPLPAEAATAPLPQAFVAEAAPAPVDDLPSPSSLGMTDLAARLADSMRRRRERARAAAAAASSEVPAAPAPALATDPVAAQAAQTLAGPAPLPAVETVADSSPAPSDPVLAPPVAQEVPVPQAPLVMPAAMRPLALDAFLEDDPGADAVLPPRHIAMPATPPAPAPFAAPVAQAPAADALPAVSAEEAEGAIETSLADASEDNPYASLLGVAPARHAHVRIDEPEAETGGGIEPVVIFPGQTGQVVPLAPAAEDPADAQGFRRFDAPGSAGQGQPVSGHQATALVPPDEAAQALRAALSNLQRMSGAA